MGWSWPPRVAELLSAPPWRGVAARDRAVLAAALGPAGGEVELAAARPARPSEAVELARGHDPVELALARAMGAEWLDRYLAEWRSVALEIDGEDLIAAGVPQGPAIGRGLQEALRRKLDGEIAGREQELAAALEAARPGSDRRVLLCYRMRWRESDGVRWLEAELPGARAAFSTRLGGVSEAPFESLNLGVLTDDDRDSVVENRHRSPPRSASPRSGSRSAARSTAPSWPSTPAPGAEPVRANPAAPSSPRSTGTSSPSRAWRRSSSSPTACRSPSPGPGGSRCCTAAGAGWRPGSSPGAPRR